MSFWDNLRNLGKNITDSVEQSAGLPSGDGSYKPMPYNEQANPAAVNGHKEPQLNWLDGVSYSDYEDFMPKREAFYNMVSEWENEDDYQKRINILDSYDQQYGFSNNAIQRDLLNELRAREDYAHRQENMYKDPGDLPAYSYYDLANNRRGMANWAKENQDYVAWRIGRDNNI